MQPQNSINTSASGLRNVKEKKISKSSVGKAQISETGKKIGDGKGDASQSNVNNIIGMRSGDEDLVEDSPGLIGTHELQIGKLDSDQREDMAINESTAE